MAQDEVLGPPALQTTPFSPGRTLNASLAIFLRNLLPFLTVTIVISLPYIAVQTWADIAAARATEPETGLSPVAIGIFMVQSVTFGFVQAALTYGTVQDLRGQRAGIVDNLRGGLARSGHIATGALQYGLLLGLATLLLIVPGILLYLRWWVFMPAMVIEDLTPSASFERSKELTQGRRWAIFGLSALILVIEIAVMFGLVMLLEGLGGSIIITVLGVLFTTFSSVVAAVGYYHLRVEKEGVIIDDIAKVFD
jgi:hypothetical protein